MKKVIHNLRQKPEHVKTLILHTGVIVCGFILFSFWVWNFKNINVTEIKKDFEKNLPPLSGLKNNLIEGYENLK